MSALVGATVGTAMTVPVHGATEAEGPTIGPTAGALQPAAVTTPVERVEPTMAAPRAPVGAT